MPSTVGTRRRFGPGTATRVMSESGRSSGTGAAGMDEEGSTGASRRPRCTLQRGGDRGRSRRDHTHDNCAEPGEVS
jgi:hypothetical protein